MPGHAGSRRIVAFGLVVATSIAVACSSDSSTKSITPPGPAFSAPLPIAIGDHRRTDVRGGRQLDRWARAAGRWDRVRHVDAHLPHPLASHVIANGTQRAIPLAVGVDNPFEIQNFVIAAGCYYWLHTHDATGIIHVEAPQTGTYTLGQFFDIWGQPLSRENVAGFTGTVTAYVDSTLYTGDLTAIDFQEHRQITLIVGTVPDTLPVYAFPSAY